MRSGVNQYEPAVGTFDECTIALADLNEVQDEVQD